MGFVHDIIKQADQKPIEVIRDTPTEQDLLEVVRYITNHKKAGTEVCWQLINDNDYSIRLRPKYLKRSQIDKQTKQYVLMRKRANISETYKYTTRLSNIASRWYVKVWVVEISRVIREYTLTKIK